MTDYNCDVCKYKSPTKASMDQHNKTKKHQTNIQQLTPTQVPVQQETVSTTPVQQQTVTATHIQQQTETSTATPTSVNSQEDKKKRGRKPKSVTEKTASNTPVVTPVTASSLSNTQNDKVNVSNAKSVTNHVYTVPRSVQTILPTVPQIDNSRIEQLENRINSLEEQLKKCEKLIEQRYTLTTNNITVTFPHVSEFETEQTHCRSIEELRRVLGDEVFKMVTGQAPFPGLPPPGMLEDGSFGEGFPTPNVDQLIKSLNLNNQNNDDSDSDDEIDFKNLKPTIKTVPKSAPVNKKTNVKQATKQTNRQAKK